MTKNILLSLSFFLFYTASFGQSPKDKMLFVIDSIPLLTDPEEWNPILQEDIADVRVVRSKDTLARLGYKDFDGITYVFTKEYRKRPDSLKEIPSLKQMIVNDGVWSLHNIPYSGRYIDYYNSGKIQDEGTLLNGRLDGELIVYFKNGNKKSVQQAERLDFDDAYVKKIVPEVILNYCRLSSPSIQIYLQFPGLP